MDERNPALPKKSWKPLFVGIYRAIIIPGFLRWCRISSIHSMMERCPSCLDSTAFESWPTNRSDGPLDQVTSAPHWVALFFCVHPSFGGFEGKPAGKQLHWGGTNEKRKRKQLSWGVEQIKKKNEHNYYYAYSSYIYIYILGGRSLQTRTPPKGNVEEKKRIQRMTPGPSSRAPFCGRQAPRRPYFVRCVEPPRRWAAWRRRTFFELVKPCP